MSNVSKRIVNATSAKPRLAVLSTVNPDRVDRSVVKWHKEMLDATLRTMWINKRALSMPYNVYTHRLVMALRVRFDRQGYHLRSQTELGSGKIVVWIRQKYRGNRPAR